MFILPVVIAVPFLFALGAVMGSFGNVFVERVPEGKSLGGRSHCVSCGKTLRMWELVPVFSWCCLGGKCARCHASIPVAFTLVELASGLLFVAAGFNALFDLTVAVPVSIALWAMLCVALTDIRTRTIPDVLTIIIAVCGLILRLEDQILPAIAICIGGGFFAIQWIISRGKWVGSGDIFLGAALGLFLGTWELAGLMLWFAYVIGLFFVLARLPFRHLDLNAHIPFGPFIVLGATLALFFGNALLAFVLP